ncbi:MAG: S24/S26 family peptidase, partial [Anaerolineaceae bacterium]|nr:S24/S26 family peptidase [Anaerolineaceae bacterium]
MAKMTYEDILSRDGKLVPKIQGASMEPMLRQDRDLVVIEMPESRLKPGDVALYKRGEKYVLHRVIRAEKDTYFIRGDNTYVLEKVPESAVLGIMTNFSRKGKTYRVTDRSYRLYVRVWTALFPLRFFLSRSRKAAVSVLRKLGLLPYI